MANNIKITDQSQLSEFRQELHKKLETLIKENQTVNILSGVKSGLNQTNAVSKFVNHVRANNEAIIENTIYIGADRPAGRGTGYGSKGASPNSQATEAIRLVAGRMRRTPVEDGTHVDPSFASDGATLYMSDMTDVDTNIGFCDGPLGNKKAQSAIAGVADQIRFFGYNGIQFSTGMPAGVKGITNGITTALGGSIPKAPRIVFAAGNIDSTTDIFGLKEEDNEEVNIIQGIAKGENLEACVSELANILDKIVGALERLALMQGAMYSLEQVQLPAGINPHLPAVKGVAVIENYSKFLASISALRVEKTTWELAYLEELSPKKLSSTNVFTS